MDLPNFKKYFLIDSIKKYFTEFWSIYRTLKNIF